MRLFRDREEAGEKLAEALKNYHDKDVIVLGLPRGGVVVAKKIAESLGAPLNVIFSKKIGHPMQEEYAIAAVCEDGTAVINEREVQEVGEEWFKIKKHEALELMKKRRKLYLQGREKPVLTGKIVIVVDDGIATGLSILAALQEVQRKKPKKLIVAVPVLPQQVAQELEQTIDELVALRIDPAFLGGVGAYYDKFDQVSDEEVMRSLQRES